MTEGRFVGDRYHLVRELGRGGMGVVYLGRDLRLDMDVAIKFRGVPHTDATLWLKREFRAVASLRHPNLVELYELVAHDKTCYFTMEYLPGIDPRRWVERADQLSPVYADRTTATVPPLQDAHTEISSDRSRSPIDPLPRPASPPVVDFGRVRAVLAQLAEGLAFLHASGVIHRDVKPSNAIIVDGTVKLLDFGLSIAERRRETTEVRVVGTAAYLAPEYLERLAIGPQMDIYALGVLGYELVTGGPPFGTMSTLARLALDAPRASAFNPEVPADLDELIARMMEANPARRPTALDVADALTGSQSQPRAPRRAQRFVGRAAELARIGAAIEDPAPHARFVLVTGPSGVGKSVLLDEALHRWRTAETASWRGRCHERERVPYRAFDPIIDDLASELADNPTLAREIAHAAALARVFPVLAPLLDARDAPVAADLRVERERALLAMTQLFEHALRAQRGIVVIDDLQWADDDSLELLALLVERVEQPLTVLATWASETPPPAALLERLGPAAVQIALPAMGEPELAELIADLAPQTPVARLHAAARLAAGSPYLAELIGRELHDLESADVTALEARRLERLAFDERAVAELAALAGGAVTFEQLRALAELPSNRLASVLRALEDARIVRATPAASGDPVYVLYHQRLRDAAVAGMAEPVRRARHERYALWYEHAGGEPGQLAYHWREAGDPARAALHAVAAADAARAQLAWGIAADWYARALELGRDVRAQLAECLLLGGRLAAAADQFLALDGDRYRVRAGEAYLRLGEIERGLGVLDGVLARHGERRSRGRGLSIVRAALVGARWLVPARRPEPVDPVRADAYRTIASFLSTPHPIEALEYVVRGIALADRTGDRAAKAQGLAMLGAYVAAASLGRFGDRTLVMAEALASEPYPQMVVAGTRGIYAMLRGDWAAMRGAHERGERICRDLGFEISWEASFLRSYWALGELYAGEPHRTLGLLEDLATRADDLFGRAIIGSHRGRALVLAGELPAARALLARAPAADQGMAAIYRQVFAAELALAEHDWARAAALADALARTARAQWLSIMPAITAMIDVIAATAELGRAALGDRVAAQRARTAARRLHRHGRTSFYAATALRLCGQAEALLGHDPATLYAQAADVARARGGRLDQLAIAALTGAPVDAGMLARAVAWSTGGIVA